MNRSYSKIRHIQESNQILEKRLSREGNDYSIISEEPVSASALAAASAVVTTTALVGAAITIINRTGSSAEKVKQFTDLCKTSKAQITSNSNKIADTLRDAMQRIGTDEEAIYSVFKDNANPFTAIRTMNEFCSVVKSYESSYGESLYDELDSELEKDSEWNQIFRPLRDIALREKETSKSQPTTGGASPTSRMPVR
jgi:hypothetical protein